MFQKRSPWISAILIVMLLALLGFSGLPRTIGLLSGSPVLATNAPLESPLLDREANGYESVLEREPDNDFALSKLLEVKLQQRDFQGAIAPLERLIKLHPEETQYQIFLARTKLELKEIPAAETIYRQILQQQPANLEALTGIVSLEIEQKRSPEAIALLEKTLQETESKRTEVDRTAIELLLAGVYSQQEDFERASAIYDRAAVSEPKDFRPLLSKALLLKQQGKVTESQAIFERAKAIAPEGIQEQLARIAAEI
jgi:tetratricopeptide (TPR) repeat protein